MFDFARFEVQSETPFRNSTVVGANAQAAVIRNIPSAQCQFHWFALTGSTPLRIHMTNNI